MCQSIVQGLGMCVKQHGDEVVVFSACYKMHLGLCRFHQAGISQGCTSRSPCCRACMLRRSLAKPPSQGQQRGA